MFTARCRALIVLVALFFGIASAMLDVANVAAGTCPPGTTCNSGGSNGNGQLSVIQDESLSYNATTIQAMPAPAPSGVTNALPLQCTGTQDNYYALTISNISTIYLNGVNSFSSVLIVDCEVGTVVVVLHAVAEIPLAWEPDTLMVQYGVVPNP